MIETTIVNMVVTATFNQKIELYKLAKFKEVLHDPEKYGGLVAYFKSSRMKGKVSIFSSGKMISVGTKSEQEAVGELEIVKRFLVEKGFIKPTVLKPKIRNMVVILDFGESIDLEELALKHKILYEPEQFPGCILKIEDSYKASVLIFSSGKTVVTGLTSSVQIEPTIQRIAGIIKTSTN